MTNTSQLHETVYVCKDCTMSVRFFEGFTMKHLGDAHHGFDTGVNQNA